MNLLEKLEQLAARPTPLVTRWPDGDQRFVAEMKIALNDLTQLRCLIPHLVLLARAVHAKKLKAHQYSAEECLRLDREIEAELMPLIQEDASRCGAKMEDGERCERADGHSGPHRDLPD